jgi:hypothetical protein
MLLTWRTFREAMPALIKAAKEKQRELDRAAAAAAVRARAAEEAAAAAQARLVAAAEAQRKAEADAAAALEAEVADTLRRLRDDAAAAEQAAQAARPKAVEAQEQLVQICNTFAERLAAIAAAASDKLAP